MSRAALAAAAIFAALPAGAETLRIGANPEYPPYLSRDAGGGHVGLDSALMAEICTRGGFDCRWIDIDVPDLIPALARGEVDVVTGGIGYSIARDQVVDFTCPYHVTEDAFGTLWSLDPEADPGKGRVAVVRDSLHAVAMRAAGHRLVETADNAGAVQAALTGGAEVYFGSAAVVAAHPRGEELFELGRHTIPTTGAALAVAEMRPDLLARLDALLAEVSADGTLARLQAEWLAVDQGDVIATCRKPDLIS